MEKGCLSEEEFINLSAPCSHPLRAFYLDDDESTELIAFPIVSEINLFQSLVSWQREIPRILFVLLSKSKHTSLLALYKEGFRLNLGLKILEYPKN